MKKYRYTVKGYITISVPTEAYFLAFNEYEARMMAQNEGMKDPKTIKMEPLDEGTSHEV